jgi:hypothetical protein
MDVGKGTLANLADAARRAAGVDDIGLGHDEAPSCGWKDGGIA